ncbi:MAG TPA: 16S rRNA (cytidine(1402)-2'-O)-methyltransferase [Candidatus Paceibacterota bacterium]
MGTLYIVGTPIGNLEDISLRALRTLKEADFILCEDTRVTKKLLVHYQIDKPLISYHQHSDAKKASEILELLRVGKNLAFVTDAGTPGISDPGSDLVAEVVRQMPDAKIVPIPGPSALAAIASIAGFPMDKFVFLGFPPAKKGRKKFFEAVAQAEHTAIFYESPYRIIKSLEELKTLAGQAKNYKLKTVVGRELTKKFETIYRGTIGEVLDQLRVGETRGEFVVVVGKTRS